MRVLTDGTAVPSSPILASGQPAKRLVVVVGYDGAEASQRALAQACELLRSRESSLEIVYVAQCPALARLSSDALLEMQRALDDHVQDLAADLRRRLHGINHSWHFQRREGPVASQLSAVCNALKRQFGDSADVVLVVGGPSHWYHHLAGSVAATIARQDRCPLVVVP